MSSTALYTGIDLGTTNSVAAVFDGEKITVIRNAQGGFLTPSVIRLDARGHVTVGARARRFLESHPDDTACEFKRLMGSGSSVRFKSAQVDRSPIELSAEILRTLRADIHDQVGASPTCAVVSVPALFELPQCAATSEAARLAGFERCELIQEPIASALAAGWTAETADGSWLVYDLGGGTFDVSLLEEQEGFLRVVGHDGDNFLGGRDFDWIVVDWILAEMARQGGDPVRRSDPTQQGLLRRIKLAAEEARIELSRVPATTLVVPDANCNEMDLSLDRALLEQICAPLVQRSVDVCRRLLSEHKTDARRLSRIVLVGGPTVTPFLRRMVTESLEAPFGENLDPMTLVAQGAAVHAASSGLNGLPGHAHQGPGHRFVLNFPPMTSDPAPCVVGRLLVPPEGGEPQAVRMVRKDGWQTDACPLDARGGFVATVHLLPHQACEFALVGLDDAGGIVPVHPPTVTIVHGVTVGDPPLSRTVGVATADDTVQVYFKRGTALPTRRTWSFRTVETVPRGAHLSVLKVPIVQGEAGSAHLCREVGHLEISGSTLLASLPLGSEIQVTLELDRSGRLTAQALVPCLGQVFEQVASLLVPDAPVETLRGALKAHREHLQELRRNPPSRHFEELLRLGFLLDQAAGDVQAAAGGDGDAAQKARRTLIEADELFERIHGTSQWEELDREAMQWSAWASRNVAHTGTATEKGLLDQALRNLEEARSARRLSEFQTCMGIVRSLSNTAFTRRPDAWEIEFHYLSSRLDECHDLPRAERLVHEGRQALAASDRDGLRRVCLDLQRLQPPDPDDRRRGHESGVR